MNNAIDNKYFVTVWMQAIRRGENQSWVAETLKVSRQAVSAKAVYLRKRGVVLPKMARKHLRWTPADVSELNALIEEL